MNWFVDEADTHTLEELCNNTSEYEALEEAFRGKTKKLLELENMIGENRKKYIGSNKAVSGAYMDKDFDKIGNKLADIFGFKIVDFNLISEYCPNAFTVPAAYSFESMQTQYLQNIKNFKIQNADLSAVIRVTSGLWSNETFTNGEVTAIIIHEMGHNFQHNINSGIRTYMQFMSFLRLYSIIVMACSVGGAPAALHNLIMGDSELRAKMNKFAKNTGFGSLVNFCSAIRGIIRFISGEVTEIVGRLTLGIPTGLLNISHIIASGIQNPFVMVLSMAFSGIEKSQENIADTFASDNGYGPELVSALTKISLDINASDTVTGKVFRKLPLYDSICTAFAFPLVMVSSLFTSHPITPKRASNIVNDIERQMDKSDISPKMRKEMQKQIDEIKDVVDEYSKIDNVLEGQALRKALFKMNANFDRDPKGPIQKVFSSKNLTD